MLVCHDVGLLKRGVIYLRLQENVVIFCVIELGLDVQRLQNAELEKLAKIHLAA